MRLSLFLSFRQPYKTTKAELKRSDKSSALGLNNAERSIGVSGCPQPADPRVKPRQKCGLLGQMTQQQTCGSVTVCGLSMHSYHWGIKTDPALTHMAVRMHDAHNVQLIRTERRKAINVTLLSGITNRRDLRSMGKMQIFQQIILQDFPLGKTLGWTLCFLLTGSFNI